MRIPPSDAQLDALAARSSPYRAEHDRSTAIAWDASRRRPRDFRAAERFLRAECAAEVPPKLHEQRQLAEDGTPKMTGRAVSYIFGDPAGTEEHDPDDALSFYKFPFRATLAQFAAGDARQRDIGLIVSHVAIGGAGARDAAVEVGIPQQWAYDVADLALRAFLGWLSDIHVERVRGTG